MTIATGTYRDGKVQLDSTVDWPDGSRVEIVCHEPKMGMNEADWPTTPEGIAALLKDMEALEPLEMTPEEEAELAAAREAVKQYTLQKMNERFKTE